ncbi:MAG: lipoate--protein ligase family protein [Firmicutes bacterium]|nr:lipoate--protein ligase family protein [Bacillota bacterium]
MAVDEAVAAAVAAGEAPPTLRLYMWEPPALSLGYFQSRADVDEAALERRGFALVRRPTGGRAVLHWQEVTYSVVVPETWPGLPAGVTESYRWLSRGLVEGLRQLGLPVEWTAKSLVQGAGSAACFEAPSFWELTIGGRKVVGSAQVRQKGVVLQHGSVPLYFHAEVVADILGRTPQEKARLQRVLARHAAGLAEFYSGGAASPGPGGEDRPSPTPARGLQPQQLAEALAQGFARALGVQWEPGRLSAAEERAVAILAARHRSPEWLSRR